MKNIRTRYLSISLLVFCLLASFTRPIKIKKIVSASEATQIQNLKLYSLPVTGISKLPQTTLTKIEDSQLVVITNSGVGNIDYAIVKPQASPQSPFSIVGTSENTTVANSPIENMNDAVVRTDSFPQTSLSTIESSDAIIDRSVPENTDHAEGTGKENEEIRLGNSLKSISPLPVKPLPILTSRRLIGIKSMVLSDFDNTIEKEYYKYDSVAHTFKKIENIEKSFGLDPVRFSLSASKDSLINGEEVEIKIVAEYLAINPALMFQLEGSNEFTLKALLPQGFIQTGGTYFDYLKGKVTREQPRQEFTIKGYFESIIDKAEFRLLRGSVSADINSPYYLAGRLSVFQKNALVSKQEPKLQIDNLTLKKIVKGLVPTSSYLSCSTIDVSFSLDPICYGATFTVSVNGCYGSVKWVKDYNWGSPLPYTTSSFSTNFAGTYQAQCENSCGELQVGTRTTNGQYALQITVAEKTIDCNQSTATLEAVGCNGIVTWNTGDTGTTITKGAGYYTATCNQSCSSTNASANIYSPPPFPNTPTLSSDKYFLCYNESSKLTIDVGCNSGSWLDWQNQPSNTNAVGEGIYRIRCVNSCYESDYSTVSILRNYATPAAPVIAGPTSVCPGSVVSMSISTGCAGGTNFAWKDGDEFVSHGDAAGSGGSYTINASCTHACSNRTTYSNNITVYAKYYGSTPSISSNTYNLCGGDQATLSSASCDGTVVWYVKINGNGTNIGTGSSKSVGQGTYYARCQNDCGEGNQSNEVTINWNGNYASNISVTPGYTDVCDYASNVTLTVNGCNGYITWSDGQYSGFNTRENQGVGNYTAYCNAGCSTTSASATINNKGYTASTPTISVSNNKTYLCGTENTTINAANCNGTVFWNDNQSWTGNSITVGVGSYFAKCKTDCNISPASETKNIYYASPVSVTSSSITYQSNTSCGATYADISVFCSADAGGTGYNYEWSHSLGNGRGKRVYGSGTYTVTISGNNLCTVSYDITVNFISKPSPPTLTASSTACIGSSVSISSNCGGTTNFSTPVPFTMQSSAVTVYATCTVGSCTSDNSAPVTINPIDKPAKPTISTPDGTLICTTNGSVTLSVSCPAGSTPLWSNNATTTSISVSTIGSYTVKCRNTCGDSPASDAKTTTKEPVTVPTITALNNKTSLCGSETATLNATNCTGTITWSNNATGPSITVSIANLGTYSAKCTTACGVSAFSTGITINTPATPSTPSVSPLTSTICTTNGTSTLTATCTSGEPEWWDGVKAATKTVSSSGNYTVKCVNACNIYSSPVSSNVVKDPVTVPNITALNNKTSLCGSETARLDATNCTGTVTWSNGANGTSITINVAGVGAYSAKCTTACGTSAFSSSITITTPAAPSIPDLTANTLNICSTNGTATLTATCAAGEPIWWDDTKTATKVVSNGGGYTVRCVNACNIYSTTVSKTITKDPTATPTIAALNNKTSICGTETATLTASGCPGTVIWSNGTSANSITVSNAGNYTAICRTSCGDSSPSNQITINKNIPPDAPVITSAGNRTTVCLGGQSVVLSATGGCTADKVVWYGSTGGAESMTRMNTDGTLTITNASFESASMTFRAICQTNCGTSGNSNTITINKNNFTATAGSSSPNGEADEFVNNLSLYGNTTRTGVSYAWTGPNSFTSNQKDPVITAANLSYAYSGTYTVTVTDAGGCYTTATTSVLIDPVALDCNSYYVKSYYSTPTEEETTRLRRIGITNTFNPISLKLSGTEEEDLPPGIGYQWTAPAGVTLNPNAIAQIVTTSKIGNYNLRISRGSSFCDLPISISGTPCTEKSGSFECSATTSPPTTTPNQLAALNAGDEIYAADYKLLITEVTGSQSAGWNGKALATFDLLKGFSVEAFPLEFKKISVNECYEYIGATGIADPNTPDDFVGIRTQYDPNWANVYSISFAFKGIDGIKQDLIDLFQNFTNTPEYKQKIADKLAELQALIDQASSRQLDPEVKAELQAAIDAIKNPCLPCIEENVTVINNPNARGIAGTAGVCDIGNILSKLGSMSPQQLLLKCLGGAATDILFSYVGKWLELVIDDNPVKAKSITDFAGITSQMNWGETTTSAAFSCLQSINPFSSGKSKLLVAAGIAGNATAAFFTNLMGQYTTYNNTHPNDANITGFFGSIQWSPPIIAATTQALAGIAIEALKSPKVEAVARLLRQKLKKTSVFLALQRKVGSYGCNPGTWQTICKSLGIPTLCFPAGTLITTSKGLKPIEQITINEQVISYDEEKKVFEPKKVKQVFRSTATKLAMVYALSGNLIASATPEHPFFVKNSYKEAKKLAHGDTLLNYTKEVSVVDKVEIIATDKEVYNFEVEDNHNYLVGKNGVLVHNLCIPKISKIAPDWVEKGAHIHYDDIELAVRPNGNGGIVFQKVFSSTPDADFNDARRLAEEAIGDAKFRAKFIDTIEKARTYMYGVTGGLSELAKGRAAEFTFLLAALKRIN